MEDQIINDAKVSTETNIKKIFAYLIEQYKNKKDYQSLTDISVTDIENAVLEIHNNGYTISMNNINSKFLIRYGNMVNDDDDTMYFIHDNIIKFKISTKEDAEILFGWASILNICKYLHWIFYI